LITATHRDLAEDVKAGRFREDLFFRLAVFELELPPLRKRMEDIPILAQTFIRQGASDRVTGISPAALAVLLRHTWPGNVRELQNVIQHAIVMANGEEIVPEDLPEKLRSGSYSVPFELDTVIIEQSADTLEDASRRLLMTAITKNEGNASATMRELNIGRTRFYRMLKRFGLENRIQEARKLTDRRVP